MTILSQLERDLFNAAQERLRPDATAPHRRSAPPASPFRARFGRAAAGLPVILSVAVAVAVAVVAVVVLGHGHQASRSTAASSPSGGSSRAELIGALGVLRRPQTKADLQGLARLDREVRASPRPESQILKQWGYPELDRPLARVVNVRFPTWRATVLIAPIRSRLSPTSGQRPEDVQLAGTWTGTALAPGHGGLVSAPRPTSVGAWLAHGLWEDGPAVPGLAEVHLHRPNLFGGVLLVPDGVASVKLGRFRLSNEVAGFSTEALKAALATLHGTAIVHDNIAAFQLALPAYTGPPYHPTGPTGARPPAIGLFEATAQDTWLDASGRVIRSTTTQVGVTVNVGHAASH